MNNAPKKKYLVILGARPNFVKAAPFFRRAKEYSNMEFTLAHTGQHFDENMSKIFFDQMNIPKPDIQLDIKGEFHTEKIGKMFSSLKKVVSEGDYTGVIVFGDINSTLAGAIAAVSQGKKLIHIESGLRSHDRRMPEEINRAIVDHLSDHLFATEESAVMNLLKEGIPEEKISLVGNIMIESLEIYKEFFQASKITQELGLSKNKYVVATIHRAENTDDKKVLENILNVLQEVANKYTVIFPLHPGTKKIIAEFGLISMLDNITIIEPLGYFDFMRLIVDSKGVVTDSGGIQEETTHLAIPCCTLRDNTERPVTITHGSNKLFPLETMESKEIIEHLERTDFMPGGIPLWDDQVSKRILDVLDHLL